MPPEGFWIISMRSNFIQQYLKHILHICSPKPNFWESDRTGSTVHLRHKYGWHLFISGRTCKLLTAATGVGWSEREAGPLGLLHICPSHSCLKCRKKLGISQIFCWILPPSNKVGPGKSLLQWDSSTWEIIWSSWISASWHSPTSAVNFRQLCCCFLHL